jgi:hypothetical protein
VRELIPGGTGWGDAPLTAAVASEQLRERGDEEGARAAAEKAQGGLHWVKEAAAKTGDDIAGKVGGALDFAGKLVAFLTHPATLVVGGVLVVAVLAAPYVSLLRRAD